MKIHRSKIDMFLEKLISRKLLVLIIAVVFLGMGKLDGEQFVEISMAYVGAQAIVDATAGLIKGSNDSQASIDAS